MEASIPESLTWFKATKSNSGNGCVGAARLPDGGMAIRHTQRPGERTIAFTSAEWDRLLDEAVNGSVSGYVTHLPQGGVSVRRSQQADAVIEYTDFEWLCFCDGARQGEFNLAKASY